MNIIGLIVLVLVFIAIITLAIIFKKKFFITIASVAAIGVIIVVIRNFEFFYYNDDKVVTSSEVDLNKEIQINVKNHYMCSRGYVQFACKYDKEQMKEIISKQFDNVIYNTENEKLFFSDTNVMLSLSYVKKEHKFFYDRYIYRAWDESENITGNGDYTEDLIIPFPDSMLDRNFALKDNICQLQCDFEMLKTYYESIDIAEIFEDEIVISLEKQKISIKPLDENKVEFILG